MDGSAERQRWRVGGAEGEALWGKGLLRVSGGLSKAGRHRGQNPRLRQELPATFVEAQLRGDWMSR